MREKLFLTKKWRNGLQASTPKIQWREHAYQDLQRLYDFLALESESSAKRVIGLLLEATRKLQIHPRIGIKINSIKSREVRKLVIRNYELRYEIKENRIIVLRFWHGRENR